MDSPSHAKNVGDRNCIFFSMKNTCWGLNCKPLYPKSKHSCESFQDISCNPIIFFLKQQWKVEQECNTVKNLSGFASPCCSIFSMLIEHSRISIKITSSQISFNDTFLSLTFFYRRVVLLRQPKYGLCLLHSKQMNWTFFPLRALLISSRATFCCLTEAVSNNLVLFFDHPLHCPVFMLEVRPRASELPLSFTGLAKFQWGQQLLSPLHSWVLHFYHCISIIASEISHSFIPNIRILHTGNFSL